MYVLGSDFGTKKLGLAILETSTEVCSPLPILANDDLLWGRLAEIIASYRINEIVMGMPSYEGTAKKVQRFAKELASRHDVAVHFVSEDNTSIAIKKELTTQKQKKNLDSYSAIAMLQQWSTASQSHSN